jgi:hypothetical protein
MKKTYLSQAERSQFILTAELKNILIGLLLGDLYLQKTPKSRNNMLRFIQGTVNQDYAFHLYELFKEFCSAAPKISNAPVDKRTGKTYSRVRFNTYSLPCFNELRDLFYVENKKVIPSNIGDLLTIEGLCYWICDDGYWSGNGVHLCTDSFTLEEVNLLVKTLIAKFNLKCTINKTNGNFRIRISSKSIPELQKYLAPIMPSMMHYKIGL